MYSKWIKPSHSNKCSVNNHQARACPENAFKVLGYSSREGDTAVITVWCCQIEWEKAQRAPWKLFSFNGATSYPLSASCRRHSKENKITDTEQKRSCRHSLRSRDSHKTGCQGLHAPISTKISHTLLRSRTR